MRRGDLRHEDAPRRARWNWGWLEGCFGDTKISASDIDAVWERRGKFLVVEVKRPDEELPRGQLLLLQRLARFKERFTVVLVRGPKDTPSQIQRVTPAGLGPEEPSSQEDFRRRVATWFSAVEGVEPASPPAPKVSVWKPTAQDLENAKYWDLDKPDPE